MSRWPGNGVGIQKTTTASFASGIWNLNEQLLARKSSAWPLPDPIKEISGLVFYVDASNTSSYSGSGNTWFDLSGNGNNFTQYGTTTFVSAGATSYFTNFSASASWKGSATMLPSGSSPRTIISIMQTPTSFAGYNHVFHYGSQSTGQSFGIACTASGNLETHTWASAYNSGLTMSTNTVYFAATGVTDANTQHAWLNSSSATGGGNASVNTGTGFNAQIGSRIDSAATETWGNGRIYLMAAYNKKLSNEEILTIYNFFKSRFGYA